MSVISRILKYGNGLYSRIKYGFLYDYSMSDVLMEKLQRNKERQKKLSYNLYKKLK